MPEMIHCITFYPIKKFPETFITQVFKHRHQEVIKKVDETVTCKFIYNYEVVVL